MQGCALHKYFVSDNWFQTFNELTGFCRAYGSRGAFSQSCRELADVVSQSSGYLDTNNLLHITLHEADAKAGRKLSLTSSRKIVRRRPNHLNELCMKQER